MELVLYRRVHLTQGPTRLKERRAKARGALPKHCAITDGPRLGHALELIGGNELGVHGEGCGLRQIQLIDLLPHIA
jgi:hypothetical protein